MRHAIILAAGAGSRLRSEEPWKPLTKVGDRSLILHVLHTLMAAGATTATVVTGHGAEAVAVECAQYPITVNTVFNPDWERAPNGVSFLRAAEFVRPGTFLSMSDHLLSVELAQRLVAGAEAPLALAVDRQLGHPWVDEEDVTRVRTRDGYIQAIGKDLLIYDCYDTGLFLVGQELVSALSGQASPSLSQGVAKLAAVGQAQAVDIGLAPWLDVDDPRALNLARSSWRQV